MPGAAASRWAWPLALVAAALGAVVLYPAPRELLDWQPALVLEQPWRVVTAAWVHWSPRHLVMNLAGCGVIAWLGWRAQLGTRAALTWLLAWPLTHWGLLAQPALRHYGGLSGVLHAAAAIIACQLLARPAGQRSRLVGALLGGGLLVKIATETPWGAATRVVEGWDFALAPAAHASGALAGVLAWLAVGREPRRP